MEGEEISLQELQERSNQQKARWTKVRQFCGLVQRYDYDYVWIDTCYIDKTSCAELQEAISSMFHLNDVSRSVAEEGDDY